MIDKHLKEVTGEVICSFRVWTRHFVQRAFLADSIESIDFADVVRCPRPDNQKICWSQLMLVNWRTIHIVLNGLDGLARVECTQKR